ncbi:arginine/serine-rich protein PNISR-like isoform X1 [Melia azedarach]|uniref:Arginine/serine-rich protein PNISR-like isoform X1 n=1 Tax=Melia azedarach TaxID=155640 RepID=A0ACC1XM61_MELAZ|nr:arginine/serine-rich protein PNISR-like isoform X1 [Melia azedarach]
MEEEKAAAYYDELTRKGGGAARFKQGLGFSSSSTSENDAVPPKHTSSSSSFLSNFVKATNTTTTSSNFVKASSPTATRRRRRRKSASPPRERREGNRRVLEKERKGKVDYSQLIEGYDRMTPAERVKAKMKLQLAETAEKDETKGSGWERFEFDKDAPVDDEEIEAAEDDAAIVKHIGQSFRFSAIEARREEHIKAAHDEAMFGASAVPPSVSSDSEPEPDNGEKNSNDSDLASSLFSETVLAKQQGSWRDRARKA